MSTGAQPCDDEPGGHEPGGDAGDGGAGRCAGALDLEAVVRAVDRHWPGWEPGAETSAAAHWGFLIGVEYPGDRLVHRPLADHPAHALAGWAAPGRWCAVGVAVRGTAHRSTTGSTGSPGATGARVIWVCHRDGRSASLLGLVGEPAVVVVSDPAPDGQPPPAGHRSGDRRSIGTEEGRVPQLLRAALSPHPTDLPYRPDRLR